MRMPWMLCVALGATACSHHSVRCDGHLTAINAPGAAVSSTATLRSDAPATPPDSRIPVQGLPSVAAPESRP